MLNVRAAAICIDIISVRFGTDHSRFRTKRIKHGFCNRPGSSVCTVKPNPDPFETELGHGNQIPDITVAAGNIVHRSPDIMPFCNRNFQFPVKIFFYFQDGFLIHLFAVCIDQLDAVIVIRIMRS